MSESIRNFWFIFEINIFRACDVKFHKMSRLFCTSFAVSRHVRYSGRTCCLASFSRNVSNRYRVSAIEYCPSLRTRRDRPNVSCSRLLWSRGLLCAMNTTDSTTCGLLMSHGWNIRWNTKHSNYVVHFVEFHLRACKWETRI